MNEDNIPQPASLRDGGSLNGPSRLGASPEGDTGGEIAQSHSAQPVSATSLSINEVIALCRILEREYINYEDREAHEAVNKLFQLKRKYDMDRGTGKESK